MVYSQVCSSVINQLFRRETYSAAVVTAVRMIDQYAQKRKYRMKAVMLDCLLNLRLTEDADEKLRKLKNQQKKVRVLAASLALAFLCLTNRLLGFVCTNVTRSRI